MFTEAHIAQLLRCENCKKTFAENKKLSKHKHCCMGVKRYKCGQCEKVFAAPLTLSVHMRLRTGEKPFECDISSITLAHLVICWSTNEYTPARGPISVKYAGKRSIKVIPSLFINGAT